MTGPNLEAMKSPNPPCMVSMLLMLLLNFPASCQERMLPFEQTLTYSLLQMDTALLGGNTKEILLWKEFMEKASARILRNHPNVRFSGADTPTAIRVLKAIDTTFTEYRFLFFTDKDKHYDMLTLAMRDRFRNSDYVHMSRNTNRQYFWEGRPDAECRTIDCDLYCEVYIGISQMIGLPLRMVQIPKHYYIRWILPDGGYFSWNPNDGLPYMDESEMECYRYLIDENRKHYLLNLSNDDIRAYYLLLQAVKYQMEKGFKDIKKAKTAYEQCMQLKPRDPLILCNYVWLYIMNPELDGSFSKDRLLGMLDTALELEDNLNYYDAKACIYALSNDFATAIKLGEEALRHGYDPYERRDKAIKHLECFKERRTCRTIE